MILPTQAKIALLAAAVIVAWARAAIMEPWHISIACDGGPEPAPR